MGLSPRQGSDALSVAPAEPRPPPPRHRAVRVNLALAPSHYAWLVGMGREYYFGYASAHKALRDLLLWAAETTPEDTHWIFTTAQKELAEAAKARQQQTVSNVFDAAHSPNLLSEPMSVQHATDSPPPEVGPPAFNVCYASPAENSTGPCSFDDMDKDSSPILVHARLPAHVCEWLTMSAHDYTSDDLSVALRIVCAVALNLGVAQDIFNVGDEALAFASSADLYAMIGIDHASSALR